MSLALSIKQLSKTYLNGKLALKDLTFDLFYGQLVALIGPNGAGKSTLIHLIAGVLKPTEGTVIVHNAKASEIAWVSQFSSIDWYLSVLDNVRLGARLGGCKYAEAESISKQSLTKINLENKIYDSPDSLSGGEQRRLQVARALAQKPLILILDEPTTGLDPVASHLLMQELRRYANQGCLVIISGHDIAFLEELADHILFLKQGELTINADKKSVINGTKQGLKDLYFTQGT